MRTGDLVETDISGLDPEFGVILGIEERYEPLRDVAIVLLASGDIWDILAQQLVRVPERVESD